MAQTDATDPFIWLEEVEGDRAMAWVNEHNARALAEMEALPTFRQHYDEALQVLTSDDRIAYPSLRGETVYNLWTDSDNPRGLWRRTALADYLAGDPTWETVLDIDALGAAEGVNWAWGGSTCLEPDYKRCIVNLSRGGSDAVERREFDTETRTFVEGGFRVPESKGSVAWEDDDTLLIGVDFGPGSLTESGYPRLVKRWRRGTPLSEAQTVYEADPTDVAVWPFAFVSGGRRITGVTPRPSFFESTYSVFRDGDLVALDLPLDADPDLAGDRLVLKLRSEWTTGGETYPLGSVLSIDFDAFVGGARDFETILVPGDRQTIEGVSALGSDVLVSSLDNVRGRLTRYTHTDAGWVGSPIEAPDFSSVDVVSTDDETGRFFFDASSFLQPSTLYLSDPGSGAGGASVQVARQLAAQFDASGLTVDQREAVSPDGTRIPYFLVYQEGLVLDGTNPTQLYAYGGFEVSRTPSYEALTGASWLANGGVYALANIRGGGEFGPAWHRSAMRENRQRAYDDFFAVAEALIADGVTSPEHLGIRGGSNGGLLMGVALTQRPDLFNAVVIQVPLLDMLRYHKLLAGASWVAEYGDPDVPEDRAFIERYSPYQNVRESVDYPTPLFTTTTRDDRVHPGHARKMAALMESMGYPVVYFENTEGGHGAGVTPEQQARLWATVYTYLDQRLR